MQQWSDVAVDSNCIDQWGGECEAAELNVFMECVRSEDGCGGERDGWAEFANKRRFDAVAY